MTIQHVTETVSGCCYLGLGSCILPVPSEHNDVVEVPILFAIVRENGDAELREGNVVRRATRLSMGSPSRDLSCPCSAHRSPAEDR